MEHAQKMILIPQDSVVGQREVNNFIPGSTQTPGDNLSRLDHEMRDILNSRAITDERDRWNLYNQVLQRYLYFVENGKRQKTQENSQQNNNDNTNNNINNSDTSLNNNEKEKEITEEFISASVPQRYRRKAEKLLDRLRSLKNSNAIYWNEKGEVTLNGVKITDSNIIHLINDAARLRKSFNPVGRQEFADFIREQNIPRELIGNHHFWPKTRTSSAPPPSRVSETPDMITEDEEDDDSSLLEDVDDNVFSEQNLLRAPKKKYPEEKRWYHLKLN